VLHVFLQRAIEDTNVVKVNYNELVQKVALDVIRHSQECSLCIS
jgi:hypothetical protein